MTRIFLGSSRRAVFITGVVVTLQEICTCKARDGSAHGSPPPSFRLLAAQSLTVSTYAAAHARTLEAPRRARLCVRVRDLR
eukprot:6045692-Prymnesium_polylepis.1